MKFELTLYEKSISLTHVLSRLLDNYEDIQEERKVQNQKPLAESTFYRGVKQKVLSMYCSETDNWFKAKKIPFPEDYSIDRKNGFDLRDYSL